MHLPREVVNGRFRENLSQEDLRFVVTALTGNDGAQADSLMRLLTDLSTRDAILDSPKLFDYLQSLSGKVTISSELFYYVMLRNTLKAKGMDNAAVASYLAAVLARPTYSITQQDGQSFIKLDSKKPFSNTTDLIEALEHCKGYDWFCLATAIADQSLLLTGIFSELLYSDDARNSAPGLNYYENIGRDHYRMAGEHRLADEFELTDTLADLSKNFSDIRNVLNGIHQKYLQLDGVV